MEKTDFQKYIGACLGQMQTRYKDDDIELLLACDEKMPDGLIVDNPLLEYALDRRFLPYGRFYLSYGKKGCAKTSIFYDFAKLFIKNGGDVVWMETEQAADLKYAAEQGVDLNRVALYHPNSLEEALTMSEVMLRNMSKPIDKDGNTFVGDKPMLFCLDSIAGTAVENEISEEHVVGDQQPGKHARVLSEFYRRCRKLLANEKAIFLMINQLRHKIGAFGFSDDKDDALLGGESQFFNSTYQFKLFKTGENLAIDDEGAKRKVGSSHKLQCKRNKLGREGKGQEIEFDLYSKGGIDWNTPLVRFLKKNYNKIIKQAGGTVKWVEPGYSFINPLTKEEEPISIEKGYAEEQLAFIIANSVPAKERIRKAFNIPDLPPVEEILAVEKERKSKRLKKKDLTS